MLIEARGRDRKQVAISEHFIIGFVGKTLLNYKEHLFVSPLTGADSWSHFLQKAALAIATTWRN